MRSLKLGEIIRFRGAEYKVSEIEGSSPSEFRYLLRAYPTLTSFHVADWIYVDKDLKNWESQWSDKTIQSYGVFSIDESPLVEKVKEMISEIKEQMPVVDCTCDIMSNAKVYDGLHAKTCRRK